MTNTDTCYFDQYENIINDNIYLDCNFGNKTSPQFVFNLKDKTKATYSGGNDGFDLHFKGKIIKRAGKKNLKYISDTSVKVNGKSFEIYWYLYDEENTYDVQCNYYWCPGVGIIYFKSLDWGISHRLYTQNKRTNIDVGHLVDVIKNWR